MAFWALDDHLVWATKLRQPLITSQIEAAVYNDLRLQAAKKGCIVHAVTGWFDHVHMVLSIPPTLALTEVIQQIKGASSHEFPGLYWQDGYGILTVGRRNLDVAIGYVRKQKEHHAQSTALNRLERCEEEELRTLREGQALYAADEYLF